MQAVKRLRERKGILLVLSDVPQRMADEFNAWYDMEHIHERLAVPGFETASRYACANSWQQYLALYDLSRIEVLESAAYICVSGKNNSPWTARVLKRVETRRNIGVQIFPGEAVTSHHANAMLLRFPEMNEEQETDAISYLTGRSEEYQDMAQYRLFSCESETQKSHFLVIESTLPVRACQINLEHFRKCGSIPDLVKTYSKK